MNQKSYYTARPSQCKSYINLYLANDNGDEVELSCHELYHEGNTAIFEGLEYESGTKEYKVLMDALEHLNAELRSESEVISQFPDLNKNCIQRVVQLNRTIKNKAGELFPKGTLMIVTQRHKRDKEVSIRPLNGSIRVSEDACDFLGDKELFGFSSLQ